MRGPAAFLSLSLLAAAACAPGSDIETVLLPSADSPLVALRVMFEVGSIDDPPGKEGLAALTTLMVGDSGTEQRSYKELSEALYPMAAAIGTWSDREVSVFTGQVHQERLDEFTELFLEALLQPGFAAADFERNREQLLAYLTNTLRAGSDELLGLEALQQKIFAGHPYEHAPEGTVKGLAAITIDDVRSFYETRYNRANLMLGIAGGYPDGYPDRVAGALDAMPAGEQSRASLPVAAIPPGRHFTIIEKATGSVGVHFGFPLDIRRSDDDFYPLMVANSFLGEHRTSHGRLMQQLREERGLNYGDYSYIEYWPNPPGTNTPRPGFPRRQQYFSVWVRPVVPVTAHFALRNAIYEVDRLLDVGLTEEEFVTTRDFLVNYSKLWAQTLASRLGFLMDSTYYGMPPFLEEIESRLTQLSRQDVLDAVERHIQLDNFQAVIVASEAQALKAAVESDAGSPMSYANPVSDEVLSADSEIEKIRVEPDSVRVVSVQEMFERKGRKANGEG